MNNFKFENRLEQKQILVPSLILEMKLLSLNNLELEQYIKEKSEENPFIEIEENEEDIIKYFPKYNDKLVSSSDLLDKTFHQYETIYEYFENELNLLEVNEQEKNIALLIVPYLSNNGMLNKGLEEISKEIDVPYYILENGKVCICSINNIGYCSENLKEMILNQVWLSEDPQSLYLFDILFSNYEDLINKNFSKLKKAGFSDEEIGKILNLLSDIITIPSTIIDKNTNYIIPDAIVRTKEDKVIYKIIEPFKLTFYNYKIKGYEGEIKKLYNEAKNLNNAYNTRKNLFENFMKYFTFLQYEFFFKGENYIRAISQKEFAQKINISESTLSRIVNNKYIDTPFGIYSLKYFFSSSYDKKKGKNNSTNNLSKIQIINSIKQIINEEPKDDPYSDEDIVEILRKKGYYISRRTVSKYRDLAGIPSKQFRKGVTKLN